MVKEKALDGYCSSPFSKTAVENQDLQSPLYAERTSSKLLGRLQLEVHSPVGFDSRLATGGALSARDDIQEESLVCFVVGKDGHAVGMFC